MRDLSTLDNKLSSSELVKLMDEYLHEKLGERDEMIAATLWLLLTLRHGGVAVITKAEADTHKGITHRLDAALCADGCTVVVARGSANGNPPLIDLTAEDFETYRRHAK